MNKISEAKMYLYGIIVLYSNQVKSNPLCGSQYINCGHTNRSVWMKRYIYLASVIILKIALTPDVRYYTNRRLHFIGEFTLVVIIVKVIRDTVVHLIQLHRFYWLAQDPLPNTIWNLLEAVCCVYLCWNSKHLVQFLQRLAFGLGEKKEYKYPKDACRNL